MGIYGAIHPSLRPKRKSKLWLALSFWNYVSFVESTDSITVFIVIFRRTDTGFRSVLAVIGSFRADQSARLCKIFFQDHIAVCVSFHAVIKTISACQKPSQQNHLPFFKKTISKIQILCYNKIKLKFYR